jgi:hypothetical protein
MTQRERLLAIAVGGLLLAFVLSWGWGKYRSALNSRTLALSAQQNEQEQIKQQLINGEYANRFMGEYLVRSLPANPEKAKSTYKKWLLETVISNQVAKATVSANSSRSIGGLYQRFEFRVSGQSDGPNFIELLHDFYAKDYLHRIRDFSLVPMKEGGFKLEMSIDAIGLLAASTDLPVREGTSWRVDEDVAVYREKILNRNYFEPPNKPPQYNGEAVVESVLGSKSPTPLTFEDPDGHSIQFEFVESPPDFVQLDQESGMLMVTSDEKQEFDIQVRATDAGYPSHSIEQTLTVRVVDPPPKPKSPGPKPDFDDASQTLLTGLVQGGGEWTAWIHVRTRGKTLKLRVGDKFEIGSVKGTVTEVTARHVTLQIDGKEVELRQGGTLADAVQKPEEG